MNCDEFMNTLSQCLHWNEHKLRVMFESVSRQSHVEKLWMTELLGFNCHTNVRLDMINWVWHDSTTVFEPSLTLLKGFVLVKLLYFVRCISCKLDVLGALQGYSWSRHSFSSPRMSVASWEAQGKRSRRRKVRCFYLVANLMPHCPTYIVNLLKGWPFSRFPGLMFLM